MRPRLKDAALPCLVGLWLTPLVAQPRAILADGAGPWRDAQWTFTVSQFGGLLADAGYSVRVVSPPELPSVLGTPDILVAVPSLESLPFETFAAIAAHVAAGGGLMASGGEPFRTPLYAAPGGQWLDSAAYLQAFGSPPPPGAFTPPPIPTVSPAKEQYTTSSGIRVPIARGRGLYSVSYSSVRYRVIGDLLAPAATLHTGDGLARAFIVWLPWPQLFEPFRSQLIAALQTAPTGVSIRNAGADHVVWLTGEGVTGTAIIVNAGNAPVQAAFAWSVSGASGATTQPTVSLSLGPGETREVPLRIEKLQNGEYSLHFRLMLGTQEVDRLDSPVRVLDPTLSRRPDQKIRVVNGSFSAGGRHVFLRGVNYWPRFIAGLDPGSFNGQSWLHPGQYDPDLIEADLTEIAALGFNLVNIQYSDYQGTWTEEGRGLIDFLERCRNHGIWAQIALRTTVLNAAYEGQISPTLDSYIQAAYLPGNDRVFAYELLWEPMVGTHDKGGQGRIGDGGIVYDTGRLVLDPDWRAWVNDQYGSVSNAEQIWGFTAPRDSNGQLTNPLDDQIENDGPWRVMVAAYRRFLDDYLGRNLGVIARRIRGNDPDTLLTYRNWTTMSATHNRSTGYDIGTGAAHLDFFSPERYSPPLLWPDSRVYGLVTAYSRYRTGGKPVQWAEFGADIGASGGTPASRDTQAAICDSMMRQVTDDGSNGYAVWWWPGGSAPLDRSDFGIIDPDGTPRDCARALVQWNATFAAAAPDLKSDPHTTILVDRDADARGSYGLFLKHQDTYVQARQSGRSVTLVHEGAGSDTSSMPLIQVGNVPYGGAGPLKFANAEFAGIRVVCPGLEVVVENGSSVAVPPGAACQVTPRIVNTGEARWLPTTAASRGVVLHTNAGDAPLTEPLPSLQSTAVGPMTITTGQSAVALAGRMKVIGLGDFGEALKLTLTRDSNSTGACAISLSSTGPVPVPVSGVTGTIQITTAVGCRWKAASTAPWLTVDPITGSGSGALTYTIQPNYGPVRQTTIEVASHPIAVTQDGVLNPSPAPSVALSTASLSFGERTVGANGDAQAVRLTNIGSVALNLSAVTIGGLNRGDFSETNGCGEMLGPGESCGIQVTFTPTAVGIRTASLFIAGTMSGGPQEVQLSAIGVSGGPAPTIHAIADSWGYTEGIAPGLWVTIAGSYLAGAPQTWNLKGVQALPVTLGGTSVTFNGVNAALLYVSATQINALVPASVATGTVEVVVRVNGVSSAPFATTAQPAKPALYALPNADGSTFFVTAALAGTATLVGNSATDPRVVRAAYPGDTLDLYMIGLGAPLDPAQFITDKLFNGAFPVRAAVTASVGGKTANVVFAGLTSPGLYLVRIVVPGDLPAIPQPLQVSVGGIPTRPSLMLQTVEAKP